MPTQANGQIDELLELMARLRDPHTGCPWDCAQDYRSIVPHTLEECYELADTIERGDFEHLREELGDVLFQVVFYSRLAQEEGLFDFSQVVSVLVQKLLRRHPHVFPDGSLSGVAALRQGDEAAIRNRWEAIKQDERTAKQRHGLLADIPLALPALTRARKLQSRASRAGFDERQSATLQREVLGTVREFLGQAPVKEAVVKENVKDNGGKDALTEEFGELLFGVVGLARHLGVDPDAALRGANQKFETRFQVMERQLMSEGKTFSDLDEAGMQALWAQTGEA